MYNITIKLPAREDLVSKWCEIKGYQKKIIVINEEGEPVLEDNNILEIDFFQNLIKQELLNLYLGPIQNYMYTETTNIAINTVTNQIQEFSQIFTNALNIEIEKE